MSKSYNALIRIFADIRQLKNVAYVLQRDMITAMPPAAAGGREQQMVTLARLAHETLVSGRVQNLVGSAANEKKNLSEIEATNLELMERQLKAALCLENSLVDRRNELAHIGGARHMQWKADNDWAAASAHLEKIFPLTLEIAQARSAALGLNDPYNAMIEEFDPYGSVSTIERTFGPVESFLKTTLPEAYDLSAERRRNNKNISLDDQHNSVSEAVSRLNDDNLKALLHKLAEDMGFDFRRGVMYVSNHHPSCYGNPDDVRFTTQLHPANYIYALQTTAHEAGHGLYIQNLDPAYKYQPVGQFQGMTIHESQALFWENQIVRDENFLPYLKKLLGRYSQLDTGGLGLALSSYLNEIRTVSPGFIRINADEMTYPMHIFLRFDIERKLVSGKLAIRDIADYWRTGLKERLGISPCDTRDGCLQDIHWYMGSFGYFPAYTMGAMVAAQLKATMRRDLAEMPELIACGNFAPILEWLRSHIHRQGSRYSPAELVKKATGEPLNPEYFIAHLRDRYLKPTHRGEGES